jgi:hypothetical protein
MFKINQQPVIQLSFGAAGYLEYNPEDIFNKYSPD